MATERRRAAATASTGAALTFGGGVLRHQGLQAANEGKVPAFSWRHPKETHPTRALFRTGARGRRRYVLGATMGLVGAPALAVGGHDYVVRKAQHKDSFVREGLQGTQDALVQRAEGIKEVPPKHRAGPLATSAAAGAGGSWATHLSLNRVKAFSGGRRHAVRAGLAALGGTTAAAASFPLARHTVRSSDYEVTPSGVRRRKKPPVRPSSKGRVFDQRRMSTGDYRRQTVGKAEKPPSRTVQRAAIYGAGAAPLVGPLAAAHMAGSFAPRGEQRRAATTQYAGTVGGGVVGGVAGAYGTAHLAQHNPRVAHASERVAAGHARLTRHVNNLRPVSAVRSKLPHGGERTARLREAAGRTKIAKPLLRQRHAATAGGLGGKAAGALVGGAVAMQSNFHRQEQAKLRRPVVKSAEAMSVTERRKLSRKKRYAAASSTVTGLTGLGALGALALKKPRLQTGLLTTGAAIGGANSLNFAGVLRREARAQDPDKVHKGVLVAKADHREPLTRMRHDQAHDIVRRYGDAGPLPKELSREDRMRAYEARYVHAGGHKAENWQRRADVADKVKTGGLAGATAGGLGIMALRHPRVAARLGGRVHRARHAMDTATIGAATVSGAGELYAGHARRKRSSYSNSKAGVAASALRRMRDYSG